uniref:Uncharacterized protein n=1 Tax=Rhipicephalus microplus TaxID=6941 RepID=A0A6G5AF05_RHIMP
MMACFSETTMLHCYIEFQHRYFHCEEYCILHNGCHFQKYFLMPIERVVFVFSFFHFLLQRPFENWSLLRKPQTTQREFGAVCHLRYFFLQSISEKRQHGQTAIRKRSF